MDTTMILGISISGIISALLWVAYKLGAIDTRLHGHEKQSQLTLLASLWATVEAQSLQKAPIIRRIVERYHPTTAGASPEQQKAMQDKWNSFLAEIDDMGTVPQKSKHDDFMDTYDFDDEKKQDVDPTDLV